MTFNVDVVLRGSDAAVTETVAVASDAASWTDEDVRVALVEILRAIERAQNPKADRGRLVALRGFSWIVEPTAENTVVIAIEIPMGAAVAGPFAVSQAKLDAAITRVLADQNPAPQTVH
ncbi:MAG: hypothetical protein EPO35_09880 [Acidobacteria bacterium]|nr:MAG: hypothetical protein EPO35_09880 [Acidobacteriota bacterium]